MVNYNIDAASSGFDQFKRRSTNREVDPVSRSRINKSPLDDKTSSGFDQFNRRKTNQGLGSPTNQTNTKDDDDDKDVGGIGRLFAKFFGAAEENGLEFTTPDKKPKPSIYDRDDMKSFSYDPRTRTSSITGYPSDSDMRSSDEIMGSIDEMLSGENDPEYSYFSGSTYDEVRGPERNIVDAVNMAIDKTSATGDYKVRKGDTLSEIAEAAGTTVRQLQLINNIPDPKKMKAGSALRIPATTAQDKEIIETAENMSDLRPLRFANQSMMTGDQRIYAPEETADLNNPQTREGLDGSTYDEVPQTLTQGLMRPSEPLDEDYADPTEVGEKTPKQLLAQSQKLLKESGYYRGGIDGETGPQTSNAVKTFQYENGLEVTGELDLETRTKLGDTRRFTQRPEISDTNNPLLSFIAKGESGGYGAANDYNDNTKKVTFGVRDSYFSERYGKPIDKLTVSEIQDIQSGGYGTREVFAVGAYQMVPKTFNAAVRALGLTGDEVFDKELQDRMAIEYLAGSKRPKLQAWLRGDQNASRTEAHEELAKEWASIPIGKPVTRKGQTMERGESYYKPENNVANAHTAEEVEALLDSLRPENVGVAGTPSMYTGMMTSLRPKPRPEKK
jgi:LysM repeat protein